MKIELIYFAGCPNIEAARDNLKAALAKAELNTEWIEWDHNDDNAPDYVLKYGSPTILIDEKDVAGGPDNCCSPNSCRIYEDGKAPAVEMICSALSTKEGCCCS